MIELENVTERNSKIIANYEILVVSKIVTNLLFKILQSG